MSDTANGGFHAFLSAPNGGALKDLGTLGGTISHGLAVNTSGQVVGYSRLAGDVGPDSAFLYSGGQMLDLNDLVDPTTVPPGAWLNGALGINDDGEITGIMGMPDGSTHAFLLTPLP
jgi:probable HAF family extracellular repeat protein